MIRRGNWEDSVTVAFVNTVIDKIKEFKIEQSKCSNELIDEENYAEDIGKMFLDEFYSVYGAEMLEITEQDCDLE